MPKKSGSTIDDLDPEEQASFIRGIQGHYDKLFDPESLKEAEEEQAGTDPQDTAAKTEESFVKNLADTDSEDSDNKSATKQKKRGRFGKRGKLLLGGGGIVGFIVVGFSLFGFLNIFKLDHILRNIDAKTMSRFNAQFSGRSNTYTKAFIRLRMMQYAGSAPGDADKNLFFRANKVDTGNSLKDWFSTISTNKFEEDLMSSQGIVFTSVVDAQGHLRPGKITFGDGTSASFDPAKDGGISDAAYQRLLKANNPAELVSAINGLGSHMDQFLETEIFNSPKEARKAIKQVVNDKTYFFQVLRRRRLRRNIQNMIGVKDWTFFETTIAKYEQKKSDIQQKILSKVIPGNGEIANFLQCIFVGTCPSNSDPGATVAGEAKVIDDAAANTATADATDASGKPTKEVVDLGGNELASNAEQAITSEATNTAVANDTSTITQRIINKIVTQFVGEAAGDVATSAAGDVSKWWKIAKKIAKFNDLIEQHKISNMVKNARLSQVIAIYTMLATARDQVKTGQLTAQEFQDTMGTISGFENSEGWQKITSDSGSPTVSAAASDPSSTTSPISKEDYCNPGHVKQKDEFAWFCDDQKPNSGGRAQALETTYHNTVGKIIEPIAAVVDGINSIPVIGTLLNFASGLVSKVTGLISDVTLKPLLAATGLDKDLGKLMTFAMGKFLTFAGAGPIFTGTEPGVANFLVAGSAGVAESSTRLAGGVASTPKTLTDSNQLAANYVQDQRDSQSLFTRYASLSNPDSLGARTLFAVSTLNLPHSISSIGSLFSYPATIIGNLFTGKLFAATTPAAASDTATWAGVDTYDIPTQCQTLDPLDPNYLTLAVGVEPSADKDLQNQASAVLSSVRKDITPTVVRNEGDFWKIIYDKLGDNPQAEQIAGTIYNCALFDRQVEGGLGFTHGYTDDGGLNSGGN